jgi:hypothetical protein
MQVSRPEPAQRGGRLAARSTIPEMEFQTPFCYWKVLEQAEPCLFHFTEFPKPWMGRIAPWEFLQAEITWATDQFADLPLPTKSFSGCDLKRHHQLSTSRARRLTTLLPLPLLSRWHRLRELMSGAEM